MPADGDQGVATLQLVRELAAPGSNSAYRAEFLELVAAADRVATQTAAAR